MSFFKQFKHGLNRWERRKENKVARGSDNPLSRNNSSNALTNKSATAATSDRTGHTFTTTPHPLHLNVGRRQRPAPAYLMSLPY